MKILITSDIHGSFRAISHIKALDELNNYDKIIIAGDILYNGARNSVPSDYAPYKMVEILNSSSDKIYACLGNCDSKVDQMVLSFSLPLMNGFKIDNRKFFIAHGDESIILDFKPKKDDIKVFGHTHVPVFQMNDLGGISLNPGSMTFPKGKYNKSYIEIIDDDIYFVEFDYDVNDKVNIINKISLNNDSCL